MIKRMHIICFILILPTLVWGIQLNPESGIAEAGLLGMNDPIVLTFDRTVNETNLSNFLTARLASGHELATSIRATGNSIVIDPVTSWPTSKTVVLEIASGLPVSGRKYSGPSTLSFHVRGDEWERMEQSMNKASTRRTASDGYFENGVEVYPLPFTPNGDGVNDELHVARPGVGLRNPYIRIFSPDGIRVMSIAKSGLRNGEVIWDGVDRLGHEIRPGPYFIIVEEDSELIASGVIYVLR